MISKRTKEALAAAKARGVKMGNPNGARALRRPEVRQMVRIAAPAAIKRRADLFAQDLAPVIETLRTEGIASLGAIARTLNEREIRTRRGGKWYAMSVANLLRRLEHGQPNKG